MRQMTLCAILRVIYYLDIFFESWVLPGGHRTPLCQGYLLPGCLFEGGVHEDTRYPSQGGLVH